MLRYAIYMIAAGAMITLSVFFVLRPNHDDKEIGSSHAGLMSSRCEAAPANDLIPGEQTCEKR